MNRPSSRRASEETEPPAYSDLYSRDDSVMDRIVVSLNLDDADDLDDDDDLHPYLHHHHHPQHYVRQICDGVGTLVHSATLVDDDVDNYGEFDYYDDDYDDDAEDHLHHCHQCQICDGVGTLVHSATLADVSLEGFLHDQVDNTHMS